ncbi:hypothetical protein IFM89_037773 [Coptis chinensis]|uniref:RNase H type-1 domain-containing protein n=1 Tax=Coptis chinensis TaxID=261450 RepID=A0A835IVT5_9MAGN|nr:hypothetical protein IFM89_037773 [Coptis chinensis]
MGKAPLGHYWTLDSYGSVAHDRSGTGGIIRNAFGECLLVYAAICPKMSVYYVELWEIRKGLGLALSNEIRYINVDTDSISTVEYIYVPPASCPLLIRKCVEDIQSLLKALKHTQPLKSRLKTKLNQGTINGRGAEEISDRVADFNRYRSIPFAMEAKKARVEHSRYIPL